jgi:F5/8 type C domain/Secretion system C-terminal sorting domain
VKTKTYVFAGLLILLSCKAIAQCDTIDLALDMPAYASSEENASFPPSNSFDGDTTGTRWSSAFSDPQYIYVDLGAVHNLCQVTLFWETALGANFEIDVSTDAVTWTTAATITGNVSYKNVISIAGSSGRYVRMYGTVRGTGYGYSLYEMQVFGYPGACLSPNLAWNQPVVVSSTQSGLPASYAVDGDKNTRWGSDFSDPQFIYVDLGGQYSICQIILYWESAYASSYNIDVSNDAVTWTTIDAVTANTSITNVLSVSGTGRYVRMYGLTRATGFGYSINEFQVFGQTILPVILTDFGAINEKDRYTLLSWTAVLQVDNRSFQVERSTDGSRFSAVGEVQGPGNSSQPTEYQWTDSTPAKGIDYYRLKQVDISGQSYYSKIVTVDITVDTDSPFSTFPNPAVDRVTILNPGGLPILGITIYSASGVAVQQYGSFANSNNVQLPVSRLSHGIYVISILTSTGTQVLKFLK